MKRMKKLLAGLTACLILAGLCPARALAAGDVAKEEVVYINLDASGAVDTVDVVNIFQLDQPGRIVDYGDYESVRNMTTTDPIEYDGHTVTIDAGAGRLYYEGRMKEPRSPWRVDIVYLLDGKQRMPEELAGASGALEIRITIREDPLCLGDFFDNYALQASLTLDGDRCADIRAEGATAANVGGDKQLTYTILPGQGADISLTAQVEDFAMDGIAINGVALALDVDVDSQGLQDKVSELTDAVAALDDGAQSLSGGMEELTSGAEQLQSGTGAVQSGAASLQSGAEKLQGGVSAYQKGLDALAEQSGALKEGSQAIKDGLAQLQQALADGAISEEQVTQLQQGIDTMVQTLDAMKIGVDGLQTGVSAMDMDQVGTLIAGNDEAITELTPYVDASLVPQDLIDLLEGDNQALKGLLGLSDGLTALKEGMGQLQDGFTAFSEGVDTLTEMLGSLPDSMAQLANGVDALAAGAEELDDGVTAYTDGVAQLKDGFGDISRGVGELSGGAGTLSDGAAALSGGAEELSGGLAQAGEGAAALQEGTAAMREQTQGMDEKVQKEIDGLLSGVTGGGGEPVSFVSAENAVSAVQFVIRTPAIEKQAPAEPEPTPEPESSFWQKLTDLF